MSSPNFTVYICSRVGVVGRRVRNGALGMLGDCISENASRESAGQRTTPPKAGFFFCQFCPWASILSHSIVRKIVRKMSFREFRPADSAVLTQL
jgi:hypothetical protein